jgi:Cu+-exporting ATPase
VQVGVWVHSRQSHGEASARDPVCGMSVDPSAPVATRVRECQTYYFCSLRCAERFDRRKDPADMHEDPEGESVEPICSMRVDPRTAPQCVGAGNVTYYFCSEGCRTTFLKGSNSPSGPQRIELGRKRSHE